MSVEQSTPAVASRPRIALVTLWMAGALLSFVGAALGIRTLAGHLDVFEINLVRTGGGLAVLLGLLALRPDLRRSIDPGRALAHGPRNLVHFVGGLCWTLSIAILPLATVFSLEFTAPAWAALLAYPILGERIRRETVIGLVACLIGVLVILRPAPASFQATALLPLAAAFCFGLTVLLTRRLTRTETTVAILFWMMAIQFVMNVVAAALLPGGGLRAVPADPVLVGAGVVLILAGLLSQFCLSKALQHGEALLVLPLDFLRVPLIAVIGAVFYAEPLDLWVFAGFAVIAAGITIGLLGHARRVEEELG